MTNNFTAFTNRMKEICFSTYTIYETTYMILKSQNSTAALEKVATKIYIRLNTRGGLSD